MKVAQDERKCAKMHRNEGEKDYNRITVFGGFATNLENPKSGFSPIFKLRTKAASAISDGQ
jgi:hypothetical protein